MNKKVNMERQSTDQKIFIRGFIGVVGSGKGYNCHKLIKEENYIQLDFADCLRDMAWKMLNWKPTTPQEYDDFKKGKVYIGNYGKINGRIFLQKLGSMMREIDKDFWVKEWLINLDKIVSMGYTKICISDVRYNNELEALKSLKWKSDVKINFCDYHSERYDNTLEHESEKLAQEYLRNGFKDGDRVL